MSEAVDSTNRLDVRLADACRRFADRPAASDATVTLTYATLNERCQELAARLRQAGLIPDEPVLVAVSNLATDFAGLAAVWAAGGVSVPLHRNAMANTNRTLLSHTRARLLVNAGPNLSLPGLSNAPVQVIGNDPPPEREMLRGAAWVVPTSGSTGAPKGVVHAHGRYVAKLDAIIETMNLTARQRVLLPLQLTSAYGHWVSLTTLLTGGEVVLASPFRPEVFLEQLGSRSTAIAVVPTMLRRLRPLIEARAARPFRGVVLTGGEPLPAPLGAFIRSEWSQADIWDVYGLTETATSDFYVRPEEYDSAAGTIGRPAPGISWRIDTKTGELQIRSPFAMLGYLDEPELTKQAFSDGFLRTGDQARLRGDGYVQITGRLKDLINRGGNKIAPVEIEASFLTHPDVMEALAAGVPDPMRGESLHLIVVARPGAELEPEQLLRWATSRMERFKIPDYIHIASELPIGGTGKADRTALRAMVASNKLTRPVGPPN